MKNIIQRINIHLFLGPLPGRGWGGGAGAVVAILLCSAGVPEAQRFTLPGQSCYNYLEPQSPTIYALS